MDHLPAGYALVEVAPLGGAPGTYTYAVPPALVAQAVPGRRVIVPFGARRRAAIVLAPTSKVPEEALREVEAVLDDGPLLSAEVLELARWAADYYSAPLSHALKAALPPGAEAEEERTPVLTDKGREALAGGGIPASTRQALRAVETGETQLLRPGTIKRLVDEGLLGIEREVSAGGNAPLVEVVRWIAPENTQIPPHHKAQHAVWQQLARTSPLSMEALQTLVPGAREAVKKLESKGFVQVDEEPWTAPLHGILAQEQSPHTPTEEQTLALAQLVATLDSPESKPFLLEGVTGSGKTEVYLRLIQEARRRGDGAIVLVPEIALTPQLAGRFRARFGPEVAVLHSGLTDKARAAEWHRVRRGQARIVVGARSAVFAPIVSPRVIIVDEEHDPSFKQAEGLRYNGRDLAVVRGRLSRAVVVLGSATPSLESVLNAERGRYSHLRLRQRVDSRPMPVVELVDLRGREKVKPNEGVMPSGLLSPELQRALKETLDKGEQSIVFLNRRGHSTALLCRDCGQVRRCDSCSVAMTWHERRRRLVCHYCGAREEPPPECTACGSTRLLLTGAGTEKLEDEIAAAAPGARVGRLDRDTASTAQRLEAVLSRFSKGEIDVLVGTQMVAKGHDFPGVTLVAVLLADAGLHQPDFRSGERTSQLLTQVAGRAGRGTKPGRVLIQTFAPEAAAIAAVLTHDYGSFAQAELAEREAVEYPPFRRLCLIRVESEDDSTASNVAAACARTLSPLAGSELTILGPAPAPLARLRGRFRFQLLLKASKPATVRAAIAHLRQKLPKPPATVRVSIDVDPVDML